MGILYRDAFRTIRTIQWQVVSRGINRMVSHVLTVTYEAVLELLLGRVYNLIFHVWHLEAAHGSAAEHCQPIIITIIINYCSRL